MGYRYIWNHQKLYLMLGQKTFQTNVNLMTPMVLFSSEKFSSRCDSAVNTNITETVGKRQTA